MGCNRLVADMPPRRTTSRTTHVLSSCSSTCGHCLLIAGLVPVSTPVDRLWRSRHDAGEGEKPGHEWTQYFLAYLYIQYSGSLTASIMPSERAFCWCCCATVAWSRLERVSRWHRGSRRAGGPVGAKGSCVDETTLRAVVGPFFPISLIFVVFNATNRERDRESTLETALRVVSGQFQGVSAPF